MNTEVTCTGIFGLMLTTLMLIIKLNFTVSRNCPIFLVGFVSLVVLGLGLAGEENE